MKKLLKKIEETGDVARKEASGRPKSARTEKNIKLIEETIISQEDHPGHKIGKKKVGQNKPRPIIVKLSRYNVRKKDFSNKKTLKRSNLSITDSLASKRMEFIKKARSDGKILYKSSIENQVELYYEYH